MLIVTGDGIPARRAGAGLREGRTTTTNRTFTSSHIPTMRRKVRTRTTIVDLNLPSLLLPHTGTQPATLRSRTEPLQRSPHIFASPRGRWAPSALRASRIAPSLVGRNTRVCALSNIHVPFRYASSMHHPARAGQGWLIGQDGRPQPAIPEQRLGHAAGPNIAER